MFLYGITGSFVIVLMLCLKGPLELFILSKLGLPLVESFEATIKGGGIQGWVKGGALLLILIIQPLLAGALFLKILDRFLQATVVTNTRKFGRLAPRKAGGKVKTEEDFKDRLQLRVREEPNIGAGTGGAALAEFAREKNIKGRKPVEYVIKALIFRGSSLHFLATATSLAVWFFGIYFYPAEYQPLFALPALLLLLGPSISIYLMEFAIYVDHTQTKEARRLRLELSPTIIKVNKYHRERASSDRKRRNALIEAYALYHRLYKEPRDIFGFLRQGDDSRTRFRTLALFALTERRLGLSYIMQDYLGFLRFLRNLQSRHPHLFRTSPEGYPSPLDWKPFLPDLAQLMTLNNFLESLEKCTLRPSFKKALQFKSGGYASLNFIDREEYAALRIRFGQREMAFSDLVAIPEFRELRVRVTNFASWFNAFTSLDTPLYQIHTRMGASGLISESSLNKLIYSREKALYKAIRNISRAKRMRLIIRYGRRAMGNWAALCFWTIVNECHSFFLASFKPSTRQKYRRSIAASNLEEATNNLPIYARELSALVEEREGKFVFCSNVLVDEICENWPVLRRLRSWLPLL